LISYKLQSVSKPIAFESWKHQVQYFLVLGFVCFVFLLLVLGSLAAVDVVNDALLCCLF